MLAKKISKWKCKKIANWVVNTGYKNSISGNYHISFSEVARKFKLTIEVIVENKFIIASYIDKNKKILSETWLDEDFDMNFCGNFED